MVNNYECNYYNNISYKYFLFTNLSLIYRDVEDDLWDIDGLSKVDKYLYSNEDHVKVCSMTLLGKKIREKIYNIDI